MNVRVRFAPSPTGFLHVGGLRTALYNYLFARRHGGTMILRIEDTDRSRYVENAVENLIESLKWSGVEFDEGPVYGGEFGPYFQSERLDIYREHIKILLDNGSAYYAFDTPEEIDALRESQQKAGLDPKYDRTKMKNQFTLSEEDSQKLIASGEQCVIRLKVADDDEVRFNDVIRGEIVVNTRDLDDQVLIKSDGFPTYHLANVVDDHLMEITHVIRGEEWLPSTPKHVLLYKAFGWQMPYFAHLPLLLNKDKSKLSKRQGSVAVEDFRSQGYLKEAFVNFVALLGFNPTGDREVYDITELIELFNLEKVNKSGAVFDTAKLTWFNAHYVRHLPLDSLADRLLPILESKNIQGFTRDYLEKVIDLMRERVEFLREIPEFAPYMFSNTFDIDPEYKAKCWKDELRPFIEDLLDIYRNSPSFDHAALHDVTMKYLEEKVLKLKVVIHPLRLMITGKSAGAGMFETMEVLGRERVVSRMEEFLK